jgi:hypothetical protein
MEDEVAYDDWKEWSNQMVTCGISLANGKVPHGPIMGYHVAPLFWSMVCLLKKFWSLWGSTLGPPHRLSFNKDCATTMPCIGSLIKNGFNLF